ncbi:MAG: DNA repair protein RecN [Rhodospirillales bacterium]|nr:DNA repair protein RecN [Rhodospirillales bacterium]
MLVALSIRDVVLIDRLDLGFGPGLTVLTGETGAGKSILLDSLGLALGARAEAGLVRAGATQASAAARFAPPATHPAWSLLAEQGIARDDEIVLRRVLGSDGRSRAFVNDEPVGVTLLRRLATLLVEVQGQHEQMGLAEETSHRALLDAYATPPAIAQAARAAHAAWLAATTALAEAERRVASAERDRDFLTHAVDEMDAIAPEEGEEERLAAERLRLQQGERRAEAIAAALAELTPRDRRAQGPAAAMRAASRALARLAPPPGQGSGSDPASEPALAALARAEEALAEAEGLLARLAGDSEADPRQLERTEERLFALRALARKHGVAVVELPALRAALAARLAALHSGAAEVEARAQALATAAARRREAFAALSAARTEAARKLDRAIARQLPPLKLERTRFVTDIVPLGEAAWTAEGAESVRFLVATNPGQEPGPLARVASGGELSRLMLALKVVLAGASPAPTLIFDEVDSGIGGATAAAVGERLAAIAGEVQVLLVTHSPQVAARGAAHLRVAKETGKRARTTVEPLAGAQRREEIARMLAGSRVTQAARDAADALLTP